MGKFHIERLRPFKVCRDGSVHPSNGASTSTYARRRTRTYKKSSRQLLCYMGRKSDGTQRVCAFDVSACIYRYIVCFANSPPRCGWGGRRRGHLQWLRSAVEDQPPPDTPSWRAPRPPCAGPRCTRGTRKAPVRPARSSPCNTHTERDVNYICIH